MRKSWSSLIPGSFEYLWDTLSCQFDIESPPAITPEILPDWDMTFRSSWVLKTSEALYALQLLKKHTVNIKFCMSRNEKLEPQVVNEAMLYHFHTPSHEVCIFIRATCVIQEYVPSFHPRWYPLSMIHIVHQQRNSMVRVFWADSFVKNVVLSAHQNDPRSQTHRVTSFANNMLHQVEVNPVRYKFLHLIVNPQNCSKIVLQHLLGVLFLFSPDL